MDAGEGTGGLAQVRGGESRGQAVLCFCARRFRQVELSEVALQQPLQGDTPERRPSRGQPDF